MDTRTIIAIGLMLLIYIYFFQPTPPPPGSLVATNAIEQTSPAATQSVKAAPPSLTVNSDLRAKTYELKNDVATLKVNGLGSLIDATLVNYKKTQGKSDPVRLHFEDAGLNDSSLRTNLGIPEWKLVAASSTALSLEAKLQDVSITRSIQLEPGNYFLKIRDEIQNSSKQMLTADQNLVLLHAISKEIDPPGFWVSLFKPQAETQHAVVFSEGSLSSKILKDISSPIEKSNLVTWSGFSHKYFFMGAVPQDVSIQKFREYRDSDKGVVQELSLSTKQISPGEKSAYTYALYFGPKDIPELKKASPELTQVVEYGSWLGPIARFLLGVLHFFYSLIPNYGVGIILLTILVKIVLFPLVWKSSISMRKLQLVAPKMKSIRDKYKDDKYRMNAEMMALYKTEKVNPVGGCLPLLLQMPVFFALYRVFFVSIELRHAPFMFWINDLAAHDRFLVTPIAMTILMWVQQQVTPLPPAEEDNEAVRIQRAMMKWMPIMFGGIMLFLPSGLCLYMFTNALISVFQQLWLNKHLNLKFPLANASQSQASA